MHPLPDWNALQDRIATVPRAAPGYTTNLYGTREQVDRWCGTGSLHVLSAEGAVLVLRDDRDFHRVYHVARDLPTLRAALALLPPGRYTTDLVGETEALEPVCDAYAAGGFSHHAFLRRMSRVQVPGETASGEAALAEPDDAPDVADFLARLLDRFSEQLPDIDELRSAAATGRLLVVRRDVSLAGMLMYEVKGQLAHLRFWHVAPDAHGEGVGGRLMTSFLSRCAGVRRLVLWVIGDNARSIAIYRHYGFAEDKLLDRIMICHKD